MRSNPFSSFAAEAGGHAGRPLGGLSHVHGDTAEPLVHMTVPALLDAAVAAGGEREAFVFCEQGIRWSWNRFAAEVDRLAAGLLAVGIGPGDRVGIWSPNRSEWVLTQFASARIGAILVNLNPAYQLAELEYSINKVGMKLIVAAEGFKTSRYLDMLQTLAPELAGAALGRLGSSRLPSLRTVVRLGDAATPGMLNFGALLRLAGPAQQARLAAISAGLEPGDAINIQFTSGTTGQPKGATLTHHNIVNNARFVAQCMRLGAADRLCVPVPLYHCFGMVLAVLAAVSAGAALVFPSEGFDAAATLGAVARERCTALHGVPTMFIAMLDAAASAPADLSSLRTGIMAGAPCPIETMRRVVDEMHMAEVTICYGMTETSPVSFQSAVDDALDLRVTTVGRVHPHLEVKLVNDAGETVPVGQAGELCTRGYSVMQGYWNDAARSHEAVRDGWMMTGDLATLDENGYCNIVGRVKDMLIRGGENVYPREIEEFLFRHPKVAQVQVFGVPDERYGEEVCAWVIPKPGQSLDEAEIKRFCKGQIAHFKVPRYVRVVDELPMTVTGKPQKFLMRDAMVKFLGLTQKKTA
jgi:fatty-acyl-CoA synthase